MGKEEVRLELETEILNAPEEFGEINFYEHEDLFFVVTVDGVPFTTRHFTEVNSL